MTFASIQFLFYFLPLFLLLYFSAKQIKTKNFIFVVFSLIFYSVGYTPHLLILLFSIAVNYYVALAVDRNEGARRKRFLILGVIFNVL
ncbi:MAG: acyltransferase, partial [Xanthobacter sp. 17-67-6]